VCEVSRKNSNLCYGPDRRTWLQQQRRSLFASGDCEPPDKQTLLHWIWRLLLEVFK